jgi:serine/threonine protein phosphatase PrpC
MAIALRYAARTHLGLGPKGRNEDSGYAGPHLLVLADGMGGHAAGDVASSMIVGALAPLDDEGLSGEAALRVLGEELREANAQLRAAMQENPDLGGMGSTTIAMLRAGSKLVTAHIGDSRAYLLRDGEFSQITKDHSFVQQLVDEHRITAEEAQHHPQRSLVTRVMTGNPDDEPDLSIRELKVGDRYLLCSDGLTDFVSAEIVHEVLAEAPDAATAAEHCIDIALKASTRDNVTVVIADVVDLTADDAGEPPSTTPEIVGAAAAVRPRGRRRTRALPVSPAEKAAALTREATGIPAEEEPLTLAEEVLPRRRALLARTLGILAVAAVLLVGGGYGAYRWTQQQLFLGNDGGYVAVYRGISQQLGPIGLATLQERSDVVVSDLPGYAQEGLSGGILVADQAAAVARVQELRKAAFDCRTQNASGTPCGTTVPVSTSPVSTSPTTAATATSPGMPSGGYQPTATPASTASTASQGSTPARTPGGSIR